MDLEYDENGSVIVPEDGLKRMGIPYYAPDLTNVKKIDWKKRDSEKSVKI
jgi:hypothetical protein